MKHIQRFVFLLLLVSSNTNTINAQEINCNYSAILKTIRTLDVIPVVHQNEVKGGYHQCDTVPWEAVPKERICQGMIAYNSTDGNTYRYTGTNFENKIAQNNTRSDWERIFIIASHNSCGIYKTGAIVISENKLYRAKTNLDGTASIAITNDTVWTPIGEELSLANVITNNNSAGNSNITDLANPEDAQDAATKAYVDALSARIDTLEALLTENK